MTASRSIVFERPGVALRVRVDETPDPEPGELVVRVSLAGVCGTDAHRLSGDLGTPLAPACFGHEGVGVVEALGESAGLDSSGTPLVVGDRVFWQPPAPCGECHTCVIDENPALCERLQWPAPADRPNAASYRELATLGPNNLVYRIPEGTSDEAVIAFGCAMPTALAGFRRLGELTGTVLIQGSGPVGLASVVVASISGATQIIVIGDPAPRLDVARRLGATEIISLAETTVESRHARVMELTGGWGVDAIVEAAGHPSAFPEGFELLANNGRYLILGLYSGKAKMPVDLVWLNNHNLRIIGSLSARDEEYRRTVEIATEHGGRLDFASLVTHRYPLERTEEAITAAGAGTPVKAVVVPSMSIEQK